jgi:hypothetical protein
VLKLLDEETAIFYLLENKTHSMTHSWRKYNPPPQTHMLFKGTYIYSLSNKTEDSSFLIQ